MGNQTGASCGLGSYRLERLPQFQLGWLKSLSGAWRDWCHVPIRKQKRDSGIPRVVR